MSETIKIIEIPDGIGPVEIRKHWVGCIFETVKSNQVSFFVDSKKALHVLNQNSPSAAQWFYDYFKIGKIKEHKFRFGKEFCQVINL